MCNQENQMTMQRYQSLTGATNAYPENSMKEALALGLCSEAGEVAGKVKKILRGDPNVTPDAVMAELGDVLWYISELSLHFGFSLGDVAEHNIWKLKDRHHRGAIKGDGDSR